MLAVQHALQQMVCQAAVVPLLVCEQRDVARGRVCLRHRNMRCPAWHVENIALLPCSVSFLPAPPFHAICWTALQVMQCGQIGA